MLFATLAARRLIAYIIHTYIHKGKGNKIISIMSIYFKEYVMLTQYKPLTPIPISISIKKNTINREKDAVQA